jgi:hypothetical protein
MGGNLKRVVEKMNNLVYLEVSGQIYRATLAIDREISTTPKVVPLEIQSENCQVNINTKGWCIKCSAKD